MTIQEQLQDLGLQVSSVLLKDSFNGIKGEHKFQVTITKHTTSIKFDYTAGCGHRTHPRTGRRPKFGGLTLHDVADNKTTVPDNPTLEDSLQCLVMDANCVRHGQDFEEFCGDYGYDTDSRKAERVFKGCTESWRKLSKLCLDIDELNEIFQDF